MAIVRNATDRAQLQLAASVSKPADYTAARTIAGTAGQIMGGWEACLVFLSSSESAWTTNARRFLLGGASWASYAGTISENAAQTSEGSNAIFIGPDGTGSAALTGGALQLRPRVMWRAGSGAPAFSYTAGSINENDFTNLALMTRGVAWLLLKGVTNTAAQGDTPVWRAWAALCRVGTGSATSDVTSIPPATSWLTNTTNVSLMRQIFQANGGGNDTPGGTVVEHVALVQGDFPWDTTNNRPHHAAVEALAGAGANPFLTYAGLVAAQNAGTLPYSNCRQGRGDITHHWTLASTTAGLTSTGSGTPATFVVTNSVGTAGLSDATTIAPLHWQGGAPSITEPVLKAHDGGGTLPFTIGGTYQSGTTALQRRWVLSGTSTPVTGFDWEAVDVFGGAGTWQTTDTLPFGNFDLQVRDTNDTSRAVAMTDFLVGTFVVNHGQSGSAIWPSTGNNSLAIPVASGAQGILLRVNDDLAGSGSYAQPAMTQIRLASGQTPTANFVSSGAVLMLNEWNVHNPGHPLIFANMAISGTVMDDWTANAARGNWNYLGATLPPVAPGVASADGSGVMSFYANVMRGHCRVHIMHWNPNMSTTTGGRNAYVAAVEARFPNTPDFWWATSPAWRSPRGLPDASGSVTLRANHVLFHNERGARGVLLPAWPDTVMDGNPPATGGDLYVSPGHPAWRDLASSGGATSTGPTSDQNQVGAARLGRRYGRGLAYVFDRTIKAHGPRADLAAWTDNACATVNMELARVVRTLNGAALSQPQFWVSINGGPLWERQGATSSSPAFTVALDATATRAVFTPADGGTAWEAARLAGNLRVDYARQYPFVPNDGPAFYDDQFIEAYFDGCLYDDQTHGGRINATTPAGNPLPAAIGTGVAVTTRTTAKLLATERWTGTRNIIVRMMAADGVTVLRERTLAITGS